MTTEDTYSPDFVERIYKILKLERKLERSRVSLNKRQDFDPLLLFSFFDKYVTCPRKSADRAGKNDIEYESKQHLDIRKLKSSFKKLGISLTSSRLKKFFRRYNTAGDGKLSLHEFLDIFIPKELKEGHLQQKYFKPASITLVQRVKECTQIDHFVTLDTLFKIRDFLFLHIRVDKIIEK